MQTLRTFTYLAAAAAMTIAAPPSRTGSPTMHTPTAPATMKQLAPVLIVDAVEPCIGFWTTRLGFTKENEVPGADGKLMFASVRKDGVEIMYQTKASVLADNPAAASELVGHSVGLFITVGTLADLDATEHAIQGSPVVKARHQTFYGTTEFYIREPGGNVVGFAARQ